MRIDIDKLEIAQARCGKGLSEMGISRETLRNIRQGRKVLPRTVYKCAVALGCDVTDILKDGDAE